MITTLLASCLTAFLNLPGPARDGQLFSAQFEQPAQQKATFLAPQENERPWHPDQPIRIYNDDAESVAPQMLQDGLLAMRAFIQGSGYQIELLTQRPSPNDTKPWVLLRSGRYCAAPIYRTLGVNPTHWTMHPGCNQTATWQHELAHLLGMPHGEQLSMIWDCRQSLAVNRIALSTLASRYSRDYEPSALLPRPGCRDIADSMMTHIRGAVTVWKAPLNPETNYLLRTATAWDKAQLRTFVAKIRRHGIDAVPRHLRRGLAAAETFLYASPGMDELTIWVPGTQATTVACTPDSVYGPVVFPMLQPPPSSRATFSLQAVTHFVAQQNGVLLQWTNTLATGDDGKITIALRTIDGVLKMRRFRL